MLDRMIEIVREKFGSEYVQALLHRFKTWALEEVIAFLQQLVDGRKAQAVQLAQ